MMVNAKSVQHLADLWAGIESIFEAIDKTRNRVHKITVAAEDNNIKEIQEQCRQILHETAWDEQR